VEFFFEIERILFCECPNAKVELFRNFYEKYKNIDLNFNHNGEILDLIQPSYYNFCKIVDKKELDSRANLNSKDGLGAFLHSILHIEYSAIDLALDAIYRFRNLPQEYYMDWLRVADEEISHYLMLKNILEEIGFYYGEFAVHDKLFIAMQQSSNIVLRMALIPRFLEANGLDANLKMVQKVKMIQNRAIKSKILSALEIILKDEIGHVRVGDKWFKILKSDKDDYFELIKSVYPKAFDKFPQMNEELRLEAGFSIEELNRIKLGGF